jgi:threonine/homoserine/homoserine lactone efflux protein
MFLIMAGMGKLFESENVKIAIGLAGGAFLVWMAIGMLRELRKHTQTEEPSKTKAKSPLWIGVVLTAGNPYFLLWWVTIGLALATQARELGVFAFAVFAIIHWLCDLIWLEILSFSSFKGSEFFGPRIQRIILLICTIAIFGFAAWFLFDASRALIQVMAA